MKRPDLQAVHRLRQSLTAKEIARAFAVNVRTVARWLALPLDHQTVHGCRPRLIGDADLPRVIERLRATPWLTLQQLQLELFPDIHVSTVYAFLQRHKITCKRGHTLFRERDPRGIEAFKEKARGESLEQMALDESSFCLNQVPRYGWAPRGQRAHIARPASRGVRMSLLLCVRNNANNPIVGYSLRQGTFNATSFHDFLRDNLRSEGVLYMDNASIHKATHACVKNGRTPIAQLCEAKGVSPSYLPPYSPMLNPVELCFNFIKQRVRRAMVTSVDALTNAIGQAIDQLGPHVPKMFTHCMT